MYCSATTGVAIRCFPLYSTDNKRERSCAVSTTSEGSFTTVARYSTVIARPNNAQRRDLGEVDSISPSDRVMEVTLFSRDRFAIMLTQEHFVKN